MSGQLSTTFEHAAFELISDQRSFSSRSLSGKRFSRLGDYHTWRLRMTFNDMTPAEHAVLEAFLVDQDGTNETFTVIPPGKATPRGNWGGTIQYVSNASSTSMVMSGFTLSDSDAVKAGDLFTVAGSTKVYMVTADAAADGSGNATVNFKPRLIATPGASAAITHTNVAFTVFLSKSALSFSRRGYFYKGMTIELEEDFA